MLEMRILDLILIILSLTSKFHVVCFWITGSLFKIIYLFCLKAFSYCDDEQLVNIKIVEEPVITSLGGSNVNNVLNVYNRHLNEDDGLASKATHLPANFSGPSYLNKLYGKCFDYFSSKYVTSIGSS